MTPAATRQIGMLAGLLLLCGLPAAAVPAQPDTAMSPDARPAPRLIRIQMVTVGTDDVTGLVSKWEQWLDYEAFERGRIRPALAVSWGAPDSAGRDYVLMRGAGTPGVFIRVVEVDVPASPEPLTTYGWSAIELLVEDPDAVYERLLDSPFRHVGGPANLGGGLSTIRATQFAGPAGETIYFTADTAAPEVAVLPRARSFIDRPFIMVLATRDAPAAFDWYQRTFDLGGYAPRPVAVGIINRALGLPDDHTIPLGLARGAEPANSIEIDGLAPEATERERTPGQLPPAVAITTFAVDSLDGLDVEFIKPPSLLYGDRRAASFYGPAGEIVELIEMSPEPGP